MFRMSFKKKKCRATKDKRLTKDIYPKTMILLYIQLYVIIDIYIWKTRKFDNYMWSIN